MHELTFFRQARYDGGVRMGIELDGEVTLLIDFREGPPEEQDNPLGSALLWYVEHSVSRGYATYGARIRS